MISYRDFARETSISAVEHWAKAQTCYLKAFWLSILIILSVVSFYQGFKCYVQYTGNGVIIQVSVIIT